MKEIIVLSGKGGTGKTSLTAALAQIFSDQVVLCDADVDAPDLHLLMNPSVLSQHEFVCGNQAWINPDLCNGCGRCSEACAFRAIEMEQEKVRLRLNRCEGCGLCMLICTQKAITMLPHSAGYWAISKTRFGSFFCHAQLDPGSENSGKLVTQVKKEARMLAKQEAKPFLLVDGPPGIGCPTIASLTGADHVLIVTEPTRSAIHDLARLVKLVRSMELPMSCVINRSTIHPSLTQDIQEYLGIRSINHSSTIPYDPLFVSALNEGKTIIEVDQKYQTIIKRIGEDWI